MKILVIEDDALLREALCDALRELQHGAIIFEASDRSEAIRSVEPDAEINLIWLDLELPGTDGFGLLRDLLMRDPAVALVVASAREDRASILRALDLGAHGFIPKSASLKVILGALQVILAGGIYVPPHGLPRPTDLYLPNDLDLPNHLNLTSHQRQMLALLMAPVRIAHQVDFAPIADIKDGQSVGLAVEIVRTAAARMGFDIEFVPVPFEQLQGTLDHGRAVAIFPLAITPERQLLFDFTAPLHEGGGGLFVRAPSATPEGLAALSGKVVVTPRTGPLAAFIARSAPSVKLLVTTHYEESLARLVRGDADAAALNYHVGAALAARLYPGQVTMPRIFFTQMPIALGVRRGEQAVLLSWLNDGIAAIRGDGTWQRINDRWMS
jgi:DNA-binding NarL/FixJ family response regulator